MRSSWTFRVREPLRSQRGCPALTSGVLCGAGATLLHNNLGGQGSGDDDHANSPSGLPASHVPGCVGKMKTDDCSKAMGALALSTQSPEGLGPTSPCAFVARAQSSETLPAFTMPCA